MQYTNVILGTFRINCMDCLDRTNVIMGAIARACLEMQLVSLPTTSSFLQLLKTDNSELGMHNLWI